MKTIVVNATAADRGGALSILKQFISVISDDKEVSFLVFIDSNIKLEILNKSVTLIPVSGVKPFIKRFLWDSWGVKQWLKKHNVVPDVSLSLQNTNFRTGFKIPNYIYYHQSIPFYSYRWSIWRKQERILWFYKCIYPFFIKLFLNQQTEVFVQLEFIKQGFIKKFNFNQYKVHVVVPDFNKPDIQKIVTTNLNQCQLHLFYPANGCSYKNHKILIDALASINNRNIIIHLTCTKEELGLEYGNVNVDFMGVLTYEKVLSMYMSVDALVFPSYIETYGLPLMEGASLGLPVIAADVAYAREVLEGYEGATFVTYNDVTSWKENIIQLKKRKRYKPFEQLKKKGWDYLLQTIKNEI